MQLKEDFLNLRNPKIGKDRIKKMLARDEAHMEEYLSDWIAFSKDAKHVYPSQGLLTTPHDYLTFHSLQMLPQEKIVQTLRVRAFFLSMFNHPYRIKFLKKVNKGKFVPPPKIRGDAVELMIKEGLAFSIGDLGARVIGHAAPRKSRTERYAEGPFVKLGRQARSLFVGSSSPDVWNSAAAIATMAASHCMTSIPRNGLTSDIKRQVDLAKEVFFWLEKMEKLFLKNRNDRRFVANLWRRNVCATLPADPEKALERADPLVQAGVECFRVYSPEPGEGTVKTVSALRKKYNNDIEIFTGQIVSVEQAQEAQSAGADGLYVGIGGGGRCITGIRSGSLVDWPELVWQMRGKVTIPIVAEGGASDHIATTLLLGASGISVSRVASGGTIESPGGALYCADEAGRLYKPYGGEASARTKYLDGKLMPFGIPAFVEGETTKAQMNYIKFTHPTLTYNLHLLQEDAILALVFRNALDIQELHQTNPSPLGRITNEGNFQQNTH
ncbi:hypothetical protein C4564_01280 [Candidatus Microgenomates bacterium]|nr:MAG: hypothetical protein C4564_01280 [Candidatus Microgenomates bacterium]